MCSAYTKRSIAIAGGISIAAGVLALGLAATSALATSAWASSERDAEALAEKFINGPGRQSADERKQRELEARRRRELDALSEKLARARAQAAARAAKRRQSERSSPENENRDFSIRIGPPPGFANRRPAERPRREARERRVAVLMVLRPNVRSSRRRARRFARTADPVLCLRGRCYISAGAARDAREMLRGRALGPGNSLGRRAGACRRSPRCVFRNVDLGAGVAEAQAVDLGWLRHDRRRSVMIEADRTCMMIKRRLSCGLAVEAPDYRLWVVPESVARQVGARALEEAVAAGLRPVDRHAAAGRSGGWTMPN